MSSDAHIDDEALSLYVMNRIDNEAELADIEEHLLVCVTCQDRLRFEDALIAGLRQQLNDSPGLTPLRLTTVK